MSAIMFGLDAGHDLIKAGVHETNCRIEYLDARALDFFGKLPKYRSSPDEGSSRDVTLPNRGSLRGMFHSFKTAPSGGNSLC
jgi:hypothetical protein